MACMTSRMTTDTMHDSDSDGVKWRPRILSLVSCLALTQNSGREGHIMPVHDGSDSQSSRPERIESEIHGKARP